MADADRPEPILQFATAPDRYRHWRLRIDGAVAWLDLAVDEAAGVLSGQPLKLNSYDVGVDLELDDALRRLRFEHPGVRVVVLGSALAGTFCAGANIRMLAAASHAHKVNFCRITNETRNAIEDASADSGLRWLAAVNGTAAGGGYELALACDHILLVDDGSAAVSLPEVPLLAVLPGTGGLTRVVDKRGVRRDLADVFATLEEGVRGQRAVDWKLVDEIAPTSRFAAAVAERAAALAATSGRRADAAVVLPDPVCTPCADGFDLPHVRVRIDPRLRCAHVTVSGPDAEPPADAAAAVARGGALWMLALARSLDHALLRLRFEAYAIGTLVLHTAGDGARVARWDAFVAAHAPQSGFVNEVRLEWRRVLRRLDVTSRSLVALVEPDSCYVGGLAELLLAADRSYMLDGEPDLPDGPAPAVATVALGALNFGGLEGVNGRTRIATRFGPDAAAVVRCRAAIGQPLEAVQALALGLVTFAPDGIDWDDEVRQFLEERASFSPDALTAMEANLRFPGAETMHTKIFGRLTAWQNWVFQRPNAVGSDGALAAFGTGRRPRYDPQRV